MIKIDTLRVKLDSNDIREYGSNKEIKQLMVLIQSYEKAGLVKINQLSSKMIDIQTTELGDNFVWFFDYMCGQKYTENKIQPEDFEKSLKT